MNPTWNAAFFPGAKSQLITPCIPLTDATWVSDAIHSSSLLWTAWVGSLATGIMFLFGPLTTSMCEAFGCRVVTLCGGVTCVVGLVLSSFATSLTLLYVTYGLIFGIGTSLCFFSTLVVLSKYFKDRLALVNGLAAAGSGVGTIVMGPTLQTFLQRLGVSNTFLIVAGIFGVIILCGACFRPVKAKYRVAVPRSQFFDWTIFSNKAYLVWTLALALFQLGYFVPFVHLVRKSFFERLRVGYLENEPLMAPNASIPFTPKFKMYLIVYSSFISE